MSSAAASSRPVSPSCSIVGPRCYLLPPPRLNDQLELAFETRLFVPGLVNLKVPREHTNGELSSRDADLFYISNWSLLLDAKILFRNFSFKASYIQNQMHH